MYAIALAGLVLVTGATKTLGFDVWWHLVTGWFIATYHQIPYYDIFSYTAFGAPWVNHEWLFELLQWLIYDFGGVKALTATKLAVVASISWLLFRTISLTTASRTAALWGTMLFLFASSYRIMDRPYLLGMLLLALFLYILHRHCVRGTRLLWILPPLEIIWINSHGGGLLGVELPVAFAAGEMIQHLVSRGMGATQAVPPERRRSLRIVALLCILASFVNPWGADIFIFFREHAQMEAILTHTQEWLPLLHPYLDGLIPPIVFAATLFGTLLSFAANARGARISHLAVTIATSAMLYMGHRFGPEFMIANLPIMFFNFRGFAKRVGITGPDNYSAAWLSICAALLLSICALNYGTPINLKGRLLSQMGTGTVSSFTPVRMVEFLEQNDIGGRVLNDMGVGAYLIFRRWPRERVFVDGRTPVYGNAFYKEYIDAITSMRGFEALDGKYRFDYIVFPGFEAWGKRYFHEYLWDNPTWRLVYAKNDGFVYLRRDGRNRDLIPKLELDKHPIIELMKQEEAAKKAGNAPISDVGCGDR